MGEGEEEEEEEEEGRGTKVEKGGCGDRQSWGGRLFGFSQATAYGNHVARKGKGLTEPRPAPAPAGGQPLVTSDCRPSDSVLPAQCCHWSARSRSWFCCAAVAARTFSQTSTKPPALHSKLQDRRMEHSSLTICSYFSSGVLSHHLPININININILCCYVQI